MISLRSKITQKVLGYLMLHEEAELYVNEMARRLEVDPGNLIRKLKDLEKQGLLKSRVRGKERYYSLNPSYSLFKEYKRIILKTVGLEHLLQEAIRKVKGVQAACLFGSYAQDQMDSSSDVDLLLVGTHNTMDAQREIASVKKSVDREINVVNMSPKEYKGGRGEHPLLKSIRRTRRIQLI